MYLCLRRSGFKFATEWARLTVSGECCRRASPPRPVFGTAHQIVSASSGTQGLGLRYPVLQSGSSRSQQRSLVAQQAMVGGLIAPARLLHEPWR